MSFKEIVKYYRWVKTLTYVKLMDEWILANIEKTIFSGARTYFALGSGPFRRENELSMQIRVLEREMKRRETRRRETKQ